MAPHASVIAASAADLALLQSKLTKAGVKYCVGAYVDIHGVPKGKFVPVSHFEHFARGSELYTGYALDGLGQMPNEDEISSVPDLERWVQIPWRPEVAWFPADNHFHGQPYPLNTRVLLKRVLGEAAKLGFGFHLGIECEVYFVKHEDGKLSIPNPQDDLEKSCYDVKLLLDQYPLIDELVSTMNGLGWDVYSFDHEDGNSQFEFDFNYADGLTMADRYTFFRLMAKEIAAKHGLLATFMPKPFANRTGNGAHFNMSLFDKETRKNLFAAPTAGDDPKGLGLTPLAYSFIAGIVRHGRALCAALAPTVNSYKRLVRRGAMTYYSWAPVFSSFGSNNRTNSIRVPMNGGRAECRNADSSCNPYLAAALLLAAGLEGVKEHLDPGRPHEENLYELDAAQLASAGVSELPRTLGEAVEAFAVDPFIERTLGPALRDEFVKYKRAEWEQYHLSISQWEIDRYAKMF